MSLPNRKLLVGVVVATTGLMVALFTLAVLWWPDGDDDARPTIDADIDLSAPMELPDAWTDLDAEHRVELTPGATPEWTSESETLFSGPRLTPIGYGSESSVSMTEDGWTVTTVVRSGREENSTVKMRIWTAPGFPAAIIDIDAYVGMTFADDPVTATTSFTSDDAEFLTGALEHRSRPDDAAGADLLAARFDTAGPVVQIHAPDGAAGRIVEAESDDDIAIEWTVWPGDTAVTDCLDPDTPSVRAGLRLVVQFGDHPLVAPLPTPSKARALGTPIFVDATEQTGDPWADGTARNPEDMALRFRTLAFGHSDRDDPRYGNGGLLAHDMGAVFAIRPDWWDEEPIRQLRRSLEDTAIEVVPRTELSGGQRLDSPTVITDDACSAIAESAASPDHFDVLPVTSTVADQPFHASLAAPLPPIVDVGNAPRDRQRLLNHLFVADSDRALLSTGAYRAMLFPVVATRNPLEDVYANALLTPERQGQWTLHEALERRFVRRDLRGDADRYQTISFQGLFDHRRDHADALPFWSPDGALHLAASDNASPFHLYSLGRVAELDIAPHRRSSSFATWLHNPDDPASLDHTPQPVDIHVE